MTLAQQLLKLLRAPWVAILILAAFASKSNVTWADARNLAIASDAARCGGLSYVLTSVEGEDPAFAGAMMELGDVMGKIYAAHVEVHRGALVTNQDIAVARSEAAIALGRTYDREAREVVAEMGRCNGWRNAVATHLSWKSEYQKDSPAAAAKANFLSVPPPPTRAAMTPEQRMKTGRIVVQAFERWTDRGRPTPTNARAEISARGNGPMSRSEAEPIYRKQLATIKAQRDQFYEIMIQLAAVREALSGVADAKVWEEVAQTCYDQLSRFHDDMEYFRESFNLAISTQGHYVSVGREVLESQKKRLAGRMQREQKRLESWATFAKNMEVSRLCREGSQSLEVAQALVPQVAVVHAQ